MRSRSQARVERIHGLLEQQIDQGRIRSGQRLASERELAIQLGASRGVVRAALTELSRSGKIVRRVGRGTTVVAPPSADPMRASSLDIDPSPAELFEFRLAFEPSLAHLVVMRARGRDLDAIREAVNGGETAARVEEWEHWDRTFHERLVASTRNSLINIVYALAVTDVRRGARWLNVKGKSTNPERWRCYQDEHRGIFNALQDRDPARAEHLIREHLERAQKKIMSPCGNKVEDGGYTRNEAAP